MNWHVKVELLAEMQNPFEQITWAGLSRPIYKDDVRVAIEEERLHSSWEKCGPKWRKVHAERIAHFVKNGWRSAISAEVLPTKDGGYTQRPVLDGLHRLAAAIYRKDYWIIVNVCGDTDLAREALQPYAFSDNGTNVVREVSGTDKGTAVP